MALFIGRHLIFCTELKLVDEWKTVKAFIVEPLLFHKAAHKEE